MFFNIHGLGPTSPLSDPGSPNPAFISEAIAHIGQAARRAMAEREEPSANLPAESQAWASLELEALHVILSFQTQPFYVKGLLDLKEKLRARSFIPELPLETIFPLFQELMNWPFVHRGQCMEVAFLLIRNYIANAPVPLPIQAIIYEYYNFCTRDHTACTVLHFLCESGAAGHWNPDLTGTLGVAAALRPIFPLNKEHYLHLHAYYPEAIEKLHHTEEETIAHWKKLAENSVGRESEQFLAFLKRLTQREMTVTKAKALSHISLDCLIFHQTRTGKCGDWFYFVSDRFHALFHFGHISLEEYTAAIDQISHYFNPNEDQCYIECLEPFASKFSLSPAMVEKVYEVVEAKGLHYIEIEFLAKYLDFNKISGVCGDEETGEALTYRFAAIRPSFTPPVMPAWDVNKFSLLWEKKQFSEIYGKILHCRESRERFTAFLQMSMPETTFDSAFPTEKGPRDIIVLRDYASLWKILSLCGYESFIKEDVRALIPIGYAKKAAQCGFSVYPLFCFIEWIMETPELLDVKIRFPMSYLNSHDISLLDNAQKLHFLEILAKLAQRRCLQGYSKHLKDLFFDPSSIEERYRLLLAESVFIDRRILFRRVLVGSVHDLLGLREIGAPGSVPLPRFVRFEGNGSASESVPPPPCDPA